MPPRLRTETSPPRGRRPAPHKKRRKKEQKKNDHLVLEKSILNGGIGVGLLAMGVATVWFIVGLLNDWIFWYPPIPFVLGLIAVIKGLVNPEESD